MLIRLRTQLSWFSLRSKCSTGTRSTFQPMLSTLDLESEPTFGRACLCDVAAGSTRTGTIHHPASAGRSETAGSDPQVPQRSSAPARSNERASEGAEGRIRLIVISMADRRPSAPEAPVSRHRVGVSEWLCRVSCPPRSAWRLSGYLAPRARSRRTTSDRHPCEPCRRLGADARHRAQHAAGSADGHRRGALSDSEHPAETERDREQGTLPSVDPARADRRSGAGDPLQLEAISSTTSGCGSAEQYAT